jgi:DNA-binding NtrC family response regulator
MISILLVDDERDWLVSFRRTLLQYMVTSGENIFTAQNEELAFQLLKNNSIDIVFLDLILGNTSGKDVLQRIKNDYPETVVVIMTGVNDIRVALDCGKFGAADYIIKTALMEELIGNIRRIVKITQLEKENTALKSGLFSHSSDFPAFKDFITINSHMTTAFKYLSAIATSPYPLLITGESGVGKGVLAKAVAELSRPGKPFVSINVGGLDTQIFSDTLFGHRKGAFTSADSNRQGAVQQAKDGTLFLDEIGELPTQSQLKLLYLTQNGEYSQLGSDQIYKSPARFIFATNQNLEEKKRTGEFRRDLYYRLNTHYVHIPALRERPEDIPILFSHFIFSAAAEFKKDVPEISQGAVDALQSYSFPGNARQMRAMCYDLVARSEKPLIEPDDVCKYFHKGDENAHGSHLSMDDMSKLPTVDDVITQLIDQAMKLCDNNQTKAAAMIGLSQSTLSRRLKKGI